VLIRPAYVTSTYGVGEEVLAWIIAVAVGETTDLPLLRDPMGGLDRGRYMETIRPC
jgi:hypothetical protein